jgi:hypothetical protein
MKLLKTLIWEKNLPKICRNMWRIKERERDMKKEMKALCRKCAEQNRQLSQIFDSMKVWFQAPFACGHCWYIVDTLVIHCRYTVDTLSIHCWYAVDTLSTHSWYTVNTLSIHCWHIVDTLLIHIWYTVNTLSIHCQYTGDTLAIHWQYTSDTNQLCCQIFVTCIKYIIGHIVKTALFYVNIIQWLCRYTSATKMEKVTYVCT